MAVSRPLKFSYQVDSGHFRRNVSFTSSTESFWHTSLGGPLSTTYKTNLTFSCLWHFLTRTRLSRELVMMVSRAKPVETRHTGQNCLWVNGLFRSIYLDIINEGNNNILHEILCSLHGWMCRKQNHANYHWKSNVLIHGGLDLDSKLKWKHTYFKVMSLIQVKLRLSGVCVASLRHLDMLLISSSQTWTKLSTNPWTVCGATLRWRMEWQNVQGVDWLDSALGNWWGSPRHQWLLLAGIAGTLQPREVQHCLEFGGTKNQMFQHMASQGPHLGT